MSSIELSSGNLEFDEPKLYPAIKLIQQVPLRQGKEAVQSFFIYCNQQGVPAGEGIIKSIEEHTTAPYISIGIPGTEGFSTNVTIVKAPGIFGGKVYHVGITINKDGQPVGFKDFAVKDNADEVIAQGDEGNFAGDRIITIPTWQDDYYKLREAAGVDTFYVKEEYRGKGLGKSIWFVTLKVARLLGADIYYVAEDSSYRNVETKRSFYAHVLGIPHEDQTYGYAFPLTAKAAQNLIEDQE